MDIWFEMPDGWNFDDTHQDLFRLAEYVLLGKVTKISWKAGCLQEGQEEGQALHFPAELTQQLQCV